MSDQAEQAAPDFDVTIAGGGLAGVLAAARLSAANPELKIALLERDRVLGGRLRATNGEGVYGYGLNAISESLFQFWDQTLRLAPESAAELAALAPAQHRKVGVLAGGKIAEATIEQWFSPKGARTLGGMVAQKQWAEVEAILRPVDPRAGAVAAAADDEDDDEDESDEKDDGKAGASAKSHPFAHHWKQTRKAPAAVVMEHFAAAVGIPDVWSADPAAIAGRAAFHGTPLHCGSWDDAIKALTELPSFKKSVTVLTSCLVVDASFDAGTWEIDAECGTYRSRALIVAQPPWAATSWLPRALWPAALLQVASKTKPVSIVVLSERLLKTDVDIPDVIMVPSERVQAVRNDRGEISFQATIDFELSLNAPAVLKAVRGLKRARKKLLALHPGCVAEGNHIALVPVAWAQSPSHTDRRWLTRMAKKPFNTPTLAFCGDAYGDAYDGDTNLLASLTSACGAVLTSP